MDRKRLRISCKWFVLLLMAVGCSEGPELIPVEGTVTLDGQPLSNATVVFEPETGRASVGETDDSGHYELQYTAAKEGALAGTHTVSISTHRPLDPDSGIEEERPETIPAKYNANTTLKAEVPGEEGAYDFSLESDGEIIQPGESVSRPTNRGC